MATRQFRPGLVATLAMLVVAAVCLKAAFWQLDRGNTKARALAAYSERLAQGDQTLASLLALDENNHYPVRTRGEFDNRHNILLDNRTLNGVAGYHLLTPLRSDDGQWVLVNRGWIPRGPDRNVLPDIPPIEGPATVVGRTYVYSPRTFVLAEDDLSQPTWPLRVQKVEMGAIAPLLGVELAPFEIRVDPDATLEQGEQLPRVWLDTVMTPERHRAYAVQWFGLAATVVIFYIVVSVRRRPQDVA
ncbi:hypothetical protein A167_02871 [Alcanivorax sp. S71-1-4]|uniref:SURF1 family protein n=1 Tax=Alcanivorax sp. S71-1-4 TaxID=1177159 RepID=UPI00135B5926|nr:SURF1 family protein [Alcanivorax sp. S71-1-4]KAF0807539.1 hypothetical protein A167_02871 [Alcanivorax sp. S71-1-4]